MTSLAAALSKKTVSASGTWALGSATSAPMAVLLAIVSIYAGTDLRSLPLLFLLVGAVVILLLVGYSAMIREVPHSAAYYAIAARGIGRRAGVAAGTAAIVSYLAIQFCLYGLVGSLVSAYLPGAWWVWAFVAAAVVYGLGRRSIVHSTRLVMAVLILSLVIVGLFIAVSFAHPAGGHVSMDGFSTSGLWGAPGFALAIGLTVACFTGIDGGGSFVEEESGEVAGKAVSTGMMASAWSLTGVYTITAAALAITAGLGQVSAASAGDPFLPITLLQQYLGEGVSVFAIFVLVAAVLASQASFHAIVNRYLFAIGRERVFHEGLARGGAGTTTDSSVAGSRLQTLLAVLTIGGFALAGADPSLIMFNWLALMGAMGLLALLVVSNAAALAYFVRNRSRQGAVWNTVIAPVIGALLGFILLVTMLTQLGSLLGNGTNSAKPYILPAALLISAAAGYWWAAHLRRSNPAVFEGISYGIPKPLDVPDDIPDFY